MEREDLINRINRTLDVPMAILSVVMLALVVVDLTLVPDSRTAGWLEWANWVIWAAFAAELVFKVAIAKERRHYLQRHWFDVLVVIVPMFRVVRALRVLRVTKAYPLFKLVAYIGRGSGSVQVFFRERKLGYLAVLTLLVMVLGAAGAYALERDVPGTHFRTFGDAMWWSAALLTTVGADIAPRTPLGRLLAVMMMVYSMVVVVYLISAVTAHLTRWSREGGAAPAITMAPPEPDDDEIDRALGEKMR